MSDRRNRAVAVVFALVLLVGGLLVLLAGVGVFGPRRSQETLADRAVVHWWHNGSTWSYVALGVVGLLLFVLGLVLATREWRRNDGRSRTSQIVFPNFYGSPGQTTLRGASLSHSLEGDLVRLPQVGKALVGLFGEAPDVELRSILDVNDEVDLEALTTQFDEALERVRQTVGFKLHPVQVTLRFRGGAPERVLE